MIAMANAVAKTIDDLLVPSPRWRCLNLVLPLDRLDPESLAVEEVREVNWPAWRQQHKRF